MNLTLRLTADEEAKLLAKAEAQGTTPAALVRQALEPLLSAASENRSETRKANRHISEIITDRMKAVPHEVFEHLPKDGASEHDHYLYGLPKRNE